MQFQEREIITWLEEWEIISIKNKKEKKNFWIKKAAKLKSSNKSKSISKELEINC